MKAEELLLHFSQADHFLTTKESHRQVSQQKPLWQQVNAIPAILAIEQILGL